MEPKIATSNTKLGATISYVTTIIILFLPEFGIHIQETLIQKVLYAIDGLGMLLAVFGLRNAIWKNLQAMKPENNNEPQEPLPLDQ